MKEYGVFNDEGCIEDGFWSPTEAEEARQTHIANDPDTDPAVYVVHELCAEHRDKEQAKDLCDDCAAEYGV